MTKPKIVWSRPNDCGVWEMLHTPYMYVDSLLRYTSGNDWVRHDSVWIILGTHLAAQILFILVNNGCYLIQVIILTDYFALKIPMITKTVKIFYLRTLSRSCWLYLFRYCIFIFLSFLIEIIWNLFICMLSKAKSG